MLSEGFKYHQPKPSFILLIASKNLPNYEVVSLTLLFSARESKGLQVERNFN